VSGDKVALRELLHPAKSPLELRYSLAHATLKRGEASLPHRLKTSEVYYILAGQGIMHIDDESAAVGANQVIYIPPNAEQHIDNTGAADLVFLCIVDPAWRPEDESIL
jgi:mannose-6-phosphate isomerase-like protein (cupin superfamily)